MTVSKVQKQAQQILDAALAIAETSSWEAVRFSQIADQLGIPLDAIHAHFREKEDLTDAWFDRADQAMLVRCGQSDFAPLSRIERLHNSLMTWLDTLAPHRSVTRQMILGKMEPGHLHFQISGLLRISRTVQWWRESAGIETTLPLRAFEEAAMTGLYLATFAHWLMDDSEAQESTRAFLHLRLLRAEQVASLCPCNPSSERSDAAAATQPSAS